MLLSVDKRALQWVVSGDTGISSKAIWAHMQGIGPEKRWPWTWPSDPSDFGRCHRLLKFIPEWRDRIEEMGQYGPEWKALVEHWAELEAMFAVECVGDSWSAPLMYDRMKELERSRR